MQVFCDNYVENQALYHTFTEPLFLKPDGVRTRYPIGWNGYGRYLPNTLKVTYNGLPCNISEESNGIWFNFDIAPGANTNYEDYTISYVARPLDYAFSVGLPEGGYTGEEYFLFPNWNNAKGEGDGFWIGKWSASNNGSNKPQSKAGNDLWLSISRDSSISVSESKGEGFSIVRNRQWASIALWTAHHDIHVKGYIYSNSSNLDGDGTTISDIGNTILGPIIPDSWNHNGKQTGIHNMVGNLWELVDGLENRYGRIYIFDDDNKTYIDSGIDIDGNGVVLGIINTTEDILNECIGNIVSADGYIPSNLDNDYAWYNRQLCCSIRGGHYLYGDNSGLYSNSMVNPIDISNIDIGFRLSRDLI